MAKTTTPKAKPARKRSPSRQSPASTETAATVENPTPAYERKRIRDEARMQAYNQALAVDRSTWRSVNQIKESLADEDRRRFEELSAIPLPQKLSSNLTDRQRLFAYEVFRDGKQEAAYLRAGFSSKASANRAYNLMGVSGVRQAVDWLAEACAAQDDSSVEWLIRQLRAVYEVCRAAVPALDRAGKPTGEYKIDSAGALRALELIGKARKVFTTEVHVEHSGSITHLLQAIAEPGKPRLEDRAPIDVTPTPAADEPVYVEAAQQSEEPEDPEVV